MPDDGDANVFEIVSGQLRQNIGSNLILPERLLIALQPQLSQPRQNIHGVPQPDNQISRPEAIRTTIRRPPTDRGQVTSTTALRQNGSGRLSLTLDFPERFAAPIRQC